MKFLNKTKPIDLQQLNSLPSVGEAVRYERTALTS